MKQVLLIDLKNTLVDLDFDQEKMMTNVLDTLKQKFNLQQDREYQIYQFQQELSKLKPKNLDEKWDLILKKLFVNYDTQSCLDFLKSKVQFKWQKKQKQNILPYYIDNVCFADFHYLNVCYDIIFFLEGKLDTIQKLLIETTLNEYIDLSKLRYFENVDEISLFKILDVNNVFFVAQDIQSVINMTSKYENFGKFNFSQQFIHVYNQNISKEQYKDQQQVLVEQNIQYDLLTLKNLFSKLQNIKIIQQKNFQRKDLIKVGVYFDDNIYKHDKKGFVLIDKYPLFFTHFDPFCPNNNKDINIFMTKYSYFIKDYKFKKQEQEQEMFQHMQKLLKDLEEQHGHKILVSNSMEYFKVFSDRQAMADFFIDLFNQKDFQENLKKNLGNDITLDFPSTFCMDKVDIDFLKKQMQENKMQYPVVIKSSKCISVLSAYSHEVIVIKSEKQLEEFFDEYNEKLKKMLPLIVQQYILDLQDIQKIYYLFDHKVLIRYEGIDDDAEHAKVIDGIKDLKNYSEVKHFTDQEIQLQDFIGKELLKKQFLTIGLDLCSVKNTQQYFVIDTNADNFGWMAHGDKQLQQNNFYENMIQYYKKFNQLQ